MIIKNRILNGFLIKHGIKGKFLHNCKYNTHAFNYVVNKSHENEINALGGAFAWHKTPEGSTFWNEYATLYCTHHRNIIKKEI